MNGRLMSQRWVPALCLALLGLGLLVSAGPAGQRLAVARAAISSEGQQPAAQTAAPPAGQAHQTASPAAVHASLDAAHAAKARQMTDAGVKFLLSQRDADGGWSLAGANKAAVTALVVKALVQHPDYGPTHPAVTRGVEVMLSFRQADGGVYEPREGLANYSTSIVVTALAAVGDPSHGETMRQAVAYLKGQQIVAGGAGEGGPLGEDHPFIGGVSYGSHGRPDLSNVGWWMEAMHEAGVPADDPAMQRALVFVTRTQNRSESNTLAWAREGSNDGGHVYAPLLPGEGTGESKAEPQDGETGLRSYGSMTYTGFKSMLYAGLARDEPRVQAAYQWIRRHWRLDSNPNMPHAQSLQGLYYYYHVFARALRAWGEPVIVAADGVEHNWRHELIDALAERQADNGSWVNTERRWAESMPVLATCYSVLSLQEATRP